MKQGPFYPCRSLAFFLCLAVGLPSPALALREIQTVDSGLEEKQLAAALGRSSSQPNPVAAGVEESPVGGQQEAGLEEPLLPLEDRREIPAIVQGEFTVVHDRIIKAPYAPVCVICTIHPRQPGPGRVGLIAHFHDNNALQKESYQRLVRILQNHGADLSDLKIRLFHSERLDISAVTAGRIRAGIQVAWSEAGETLREDQVAVDVEPGETHIALEVREEVVQVYRLVNPLPLSQAEQIRHKDYGASRALKYIEIPVSGLGLSARLEEITVMRDTIRRIKRIGNGGRVSRKTFFRALQERTPYGDTFLWVENTPAAERRKNPQAARDLLRKWKEYLKQVQTAREAGQNPFKEMGVPDDKDEVDALGDQFLQLAVSLQEYLPRLTSKAAPDDPENLREEDGRFEGLARAAYPVIYDLIRRGRITKIVWSEDGKKGRLINWPVLQVKLAVPLMKGSALGGIHAQRYAKFRRLEYPADRRGELWVTPVAASAGLEETAQLFSKLKQSPGGVVKSGGRMYVLLGDEVFPSATEPVNKSYWFSQIPFSATTVPPGVGVIPLSSQSHTPDEEDRWRITHLISPRDAVVLDADLVGLEQVKEWRPRTTGIKPYPILRIDRRTLGTLAPAGSAAFEALIRAAGLEEGRVLNVGSAAVLKYNGRRALALST